MSNARKLASWASAHTGLPLDYAAGLPRLELTGLRQLRVEQHRGLLEYGPETVVVRTAGASIRVRGSGLTLEAMTAGELTLSGEIFALELVY